MGFIEEIVKDISRRLGIHMKSNIPHLIGMNIHTNTMRSWLKEGSSNTAEIITIWGMAGIGKTFLAKYIYMLHNQDFQRSSFVEEIETKFGQVSSRLDLQKKLLEDILKRPITEERFVEIYTSKIETALSKKETVLLVLDGVNDSRQVEVLVGRARFHPGSKIIITTKDSSITKKCALFREEVPKHTELALRGLSDTDSLKLFCLHAFRSYHPEEGYEELAIRASNYCGGHPLALEVLGRSLINEDVGAWNHTFTKLESTKFHADVNKVLQVSFDSLPSEDCRELFKHIACFFVGNDKDVTQTILTHCGIDAPHGIKKLIERCLLTIGVENELKMHQLVQDMGRGIVRQESPHKPWKRSLVWDHAESLSILQEDKGTTNIRGLLLDMKMIGKKPLLGTSSVLEFSSSRCKNIELSSNALCKMEKLVLLQLNHVKLKNSYKNFPKGLRELCMQGFELKYIPSDLPMEKLIALDMSFSNLKQLWRKQKHLGSLKYLNLSYSKLETIGDFKGLPALERLILTKCENLTHVCESIGGCENLVHLDMSYCIKLKNLPISISKLKNVKVLSLNGCICVSNKMKQMKLLNQNSVCTKSHASSSYISRLVLNRPKSFPLSLSPSLVTLYLTNSNLHSESFPIDFSSMSNLKRLSLGENPIDSMPDCLKSLSSLEELSVSGCSMLKSVLCLPRTIKHLYTEGCSSLEKITFHQDMSTPPIVYFQDAISLTEIQGVIKIQNLAQIDNEILCSLGWTNLPHLKDHKMQKWDSCIPGQAKKRPVDIYYEFGIFSTCFPGKEVPSWLANRRNGSSIAFTMPSPPSDNIVFEGINLCSVHTFSGTKMVSSLKAKVRNITKDRTWVYYGYIPVIREADKDMVWLSHWMFGNNELEAGDEVSITIMEEEDGGMCWKNSFAK